MDSSRESPFADASPSGSSAYRPRFRRTADGSAPLSRGLGSRSSVPIHERDSNLVVRTVHGDVVSDRMDGFWRTSNADEGRNAASQTEKCVDQFLILNAQVA